MSNVTKKQPSKPGSTSTRKPAASAIDRDKLRAAVRRLGDEYVFYMLDDAIDLLPPAKLAKLVSRYLWVAKTLSGLRLLTFCPGRAASPALRPVRWSPLVSAP